MSRVYLKEHKLIIVEVCTYYKNTNALILMLDWIRIQLRLITFDYIVLILLKKRKYLCILICNCIV